MECLNTKELYNTFSLLNNKTEVRHNIIESESENKNKDNIKNNINNNNSSIINIADQYSCNLCNTENSLVYDSGMIVCKSCGEINNKFLDLSQEWNNYENQSNNFIRCGHPVDLRDETLSIATSIGKSYKYYNLTRTHIYITGNYKCKTILATDSLIENKANKLNISKAIIEDIKVLYFEINNIQISRGQNREALIASCMYLTCQKKNWLINTPKLLKIFNISICDLTTANKKIPKILHSKQIKLLDNIQPLTPQDYVSSFLFKLNINKDFNNLILMIINKIIELHEINQNTPQAITCGVIYLIVKIYKLNISLNDIAEISDISLNTIKNCYKKIYSYKDKIISNKLKAKLNITFDF
jgi:transcription initiation factor TFIIB